MKTIISDEPLTEAEMKEMAASMDRQERSELCHDIGANASPVAAAKPSEATPPKPSTATTIRPSAKRREERLKAQQAKSQRESYSLTKPEPPAKPDLSGLKGLALDGDFTIIVVHTGPIRGMYINRMPSESTKLTTMWEMILGRLHVMNRKSIADGLPSVELQVADELTWAKAFTMVIAGHAERIDL